MKNYTLYTNGSCWNTSNSTTPNCARTLTDEPNTYTAAGNKTWHYQSVRSILTNEKYKGDALLQKSYVADFLTKKQVINQGEVPQYYVTASHEAIISPAVWDFVQAELAKGAANQRTQTWVDNCVFTPGGGANQAVALARLGVQSQLRSYIGQDAPGALTRTLLEAEGVNLDALVETPAQSVTVSLSLGHARAMVTSGTNACPPLTGMRKPAALLADLSAISQNRQTILNWRADPHPPLVIAEVGWDPDGNWDQSLLDHLDLADIFVPNLEEAISYSQAESPYQAGAWLTQHVPTVIITRGNEGASVFSGHDQLDVPSPTVNSVDPTGAGDTFSAGLVWALLSGLPLYKAAAVANAAAWSVPYPGGSAGAPTLQELQGWSNWPLGSNTASTLHDSRKE